MQIMYILCFFVAVVYKAYLHRQKKIKFYGKPCREGFFLHILFPKYTTTMFACFSTINKRSLTRNSIKIKYTRIC